MPSTTRLVAFALVLAACSPAAVEETTTTSSTTTIPPTTTTTTTTTTSTTTTTLPEFPRSPITGLEIADEEILERRVLAVKIDNHPNARPASGIDSADMVIEILVEGGFTRFMALWMESDSDFLGPMRSSRPTDYALLAALNGPVLARSGGQDWITSMGPPRGVRQVGEIPPATWRLAGRRSPHNLWTDTYKLRELADSRGFPNLPPLGPIWEFGPLVGVEPASTATMSFSAGTTVHWAWDAEAGLWLRSVGTQPTMVFDQQREQTQLGFPVLIALQVVQYTASPPPGQSGSSLPASRTVGSGRAFIFVDGMVVEGTWERATEEEWFRLVDSDGATLPIPPGKAWVSLVPSTRPVRYEP
jgi:hypothetical protein